MERLTFYENGKAHFSIGYSDYSGKVADKLAAYEDAEEQGLLVRMNKSEIKEFEEWKKKRAEH